MGVPRGTFLIGFTSIHWREAWKYGERAYRYCQHDLGHAIAAMRFSARMLGWQMVLVEEPADQDIAMLLGLNRDGDFTKRKTRFLIWSRP
jgi:nitroreductase